MHVSERLRLSLVGGGLSVEVETDARIPHTNPAAPTACRFADSGSTTSRLCITATNNTTYPGKPGDDRGR